MHTLVLGQTESGKTVFGQQMAKLLRKCGAKIAVFTPHYFGEEMKKEWSAHYITADKKEWLSFLYSNTDFVCFVDEAGVNFKETGDLKMMTEGRHWGHSIFLLSQRAQQVNKTMREQCSALFCLLQGNNDAKLLAEDFIDDELRDRTQAKPLNGLFVRRSSPQDKRHVKLAFNGRKNQGLEFIADMVIDKHPEPTADLMEAVGVYGQINKDFLVKKDYLYWLKEA